MKKLMIHEKAELYTIEEAELCTIDGGSEFSEWFFRTAGRVYGHAVNLHQAMQEAARSPHFGNAMYYK